jgi:DNA-binding ferritin-like protein
VPVRRSQPAGQSLFYQPEVIGAGSVHFMNAKAGVNTIKDFLYRMTVTDGPVAIDWDSAAETDFKANDMEMTPKEPAQYGSLPPIAMKAESYTYWNKEFATWILRSHKVDLWRSANLKELSTLGESERDFRVRLQQKAREQRDEAAEKLRQKYAPKIATLQERMRRAQATVEREKDEARHQKVQTALSFGTTILGGFLGRKTTSGARSTMSGMSRASKASKDVGRAKDTVESIQQQLQQLEADFKADMDGLTSKMDPQTEQLEQISVRPAKKDIAVKLLALGWLPYWRSSAGELTQAW